MAINTDGAACAYFISTKRAFHFLYGLPLFLIEYACFPEIDIKKIIADAIEIPKGFPGIKAVPGVMPRLPRLNGFRRSLRSFLSPFSHLWDS